MFRLRAVIIIGLIVGIIYALTSPKRKKRWLDKLRELAKALALSIVLYWLYMLAMLLFRMFR